jgi:hypothetical protein
MNDDRCKNSRNDVGRVGGNAKPRHRNELVNLGGVSQLICATPSEDAAGEEE